jgi:hypothetical protein
MSTAFQPAPSSLFLGISLEQVRRKLVWLMFASSFFVTFEPAPVEMFFVLVLISFLGSGLNISVAIMPMVVGLLLFNIGGLISITLVLNEVDSLAVTFVITSFYMAVTAIFFACYVAQDPLERMKIIKSGLVLAATLAAIIGMAGYFGIEGLGKYATLYDRAVGLFKDPNVFSTFLIMPAIMLMQGLLLGTERRPLVSMGCFVIILGGIFLAFSRGAWINFVMSAAMLVGLTFIPHHRQICAAVLFLFQLQGLLRLASCWQYCFLSKVPELCSWIASLW